MLFGVLFELLVMARAHFVKTDGGCRCRCCFGVLFRALFVVQVTVREHFARLMGVC